MPYERQKAREVVEDALRKFYAHLSEKEFKEVKEYLDRYVEVALRIYERIEANPEAYTLLKLLIGTDFELGIS